MNLTIFYRHQNGPERIFRTSGDDVLVGRQKDGPVQLDLSPDTRVSPAHARLSYRLSAWYVEDLGSGQGTYLNGNPVNVRTELLSGDVLKIGDTSLLVRFLTPDADLGPGVVESSTIDEVQPPASVSEDKCLEVLARVADVSATSQNQQVLLGGFLQELRGAFPHTERCTIILIEENELVPRAFWPPPHAQFSFTLARQAILNGRALTWKPQLALDNDTPLAPSLLDTTAALYAPMFSNGQMVGVVHLDSTLSSATFSQRDRDLLTIIANTMGPAIRAGGLASLPPLPTVFISYAHEDRGFVLRLADDLRRRRIKVWFDERLQGGEAWRKQLAVAIRNTGAFVLLMSPRSAESRHVAWELDTAQSFDKKILPLLYQDCEAPDAVSALHYVDIGGDYAGGLEQLVRRLHQFGPQVTRESLKIDAAEAVNERPSTAGEMSGERSTGLPVKRDSAAAPAPAILHLSDLHFGTGKDALSWFGQLADDLHLGLGCDRLDALVVSGDVANFCTPEEYQSAEQFIELLRKEFELWAHQIAIVPGNHDLSWDVSKKAYAPVRREEQPAGLLPECYIDYGQHVEIRDEEKYRQRFANFSAFYNAVKGEPYPLEYEAQYSLDYLPEQKLLILGLNSAWQLDHFYSARAGINASALSNALVEIHKGRKSYGDCLKISVWHHPLHSPFEDRIKDHGFMERLAVNDFRLALHGHVHRTDNGRYRYDLTDDGRRIDIVTSGTFGAPVKEWTPGYPLQYSLLKLSGNQLTVETRRREEPGGAWKPDARWLHGREQDPQPRYFIQL